MLELKYEHHRQFEETLSLLNKKREILRNEMHKTLDNFDDLELEDENEKKEELKRTRKRK